MSNLEKCLKCLNCNMAHLLVYDIYDKNTSLPAQTVDAAC